MDGNVVGAEAGQEFVDTINETQPFIGYIIFLFLVIVSCDH